MKKTFAAITIFLQVLPMLTNANSSVQSIDTKDVVNIGGRDYYFSSILVTIPEAVTVCQELNMTLAGFETLAEYNAVTDYVTIDLGRTDFHWTSGTLQHTMWIWSNSGKPFSYFRWDAGEPDGAGSIEPSLCILKGLMHDCKPIASYRFICEQTTSC